MRGFRAALCLLTCAGSVAAAEWSDVSALLNDRCVKCHSGFDAPMGLQLASHTDVLAGSWTGPVVVPGEPDQSRLIHRVEGSEAPQMPLDGPPFLDEAEIALLRDWIASGALQGEGTTEPIVAERQRPGPGEEVTFADVEPILLKRCIKCHSDNSKLGGPPEGLRLDTLSNVVAGGERLVVVPGNPEMSELWRRVAGFGSPRMPFDGPPWLPDEDIDLIHAWIVQGAKDADGTASAIPVGAELRLRGTLTAPNAIDGAAFLTSGSTRIDKPPRVGGAAEMRGVVLQDGQVMATRLRRR